MGTTMGNKPTPAQQNKAMMEMAFALKLQSKQMQRMAGKAEKQIAAEKKKVAKAVKEGNSEGARLYAENAISQKSQQMNYLRMASKVDATAGKLEQAVAMNQVSAQMVKITQKLQPSMNSMDSTKVGMDMEKFGEVFEELDVRVEMTSGALGGATVNMTPQDQVDSLLQEVGEEHALDVTSMLEGAKTGTRVADLNPAQEEDMEQRFAALRAQAS